MDTEKRREQKRCASITYFKRNREAVLKRNREWSIKNKEARNAQQKDWYKNNPEKMKMSALKKTYKRHGLTVEEGLKLKEGGCNSCGIKDVKLCIDHCHKTGIVRGCLCNNCNTSLGLLKESPERIVSLLAYTLNRC